MLDPFVAIWNFEALVGRQSTSPREQKSSPLFDIPQEALHFEVTLASVSTPKEMLRRMSSRSRAGGHDGSLTPNTTSNASLTDASIDQASNADTSAQFDAQNGHDSDLATSILSSPQTSLLDHRPERPFSCRDCTDSFKRQADLTRHRNKAHGTRRTNTPRAARTASESTAIVGENLNTEASTKSQITVNTEYTVANNTDAAASQNSSGGKQDTPKKRNTTRKKRGTQKNRGTTRKSQSKMGKQSFNAVGNEYDAEVPVQKLPSIQGTNYGNQYTLNVQIGHGQTFGLQSKPFHAAQGAHQMSRTPSMISSYGSEASFNQQPIAPYNPMAAGIPNVLMSQNTAVYGQMNFANQSLWPQNNQPMHPYGARHSASMPEQISPINTSGDAGPAYANHGYAQYQTPMPLQEQYNLAQVGTGFAIPQAQNSMLAQNAAFGRGSVHAIANQGPQHQTPLPPQQKNNVGNGGLAVPSCCKDTKDSETVLPQQQQQQQEKEASGTKDICEGTGPGYFPDKGIYGDGCYGTPQIYCASCRARFLQRYDDHPEELDCDIEEFLALETVDYPFTFSTDK